MKNIIKEIEFNETCATKPKSTSITPALCSIEIESKIAESPIGAVWTIFEGSFSVKLLFFSISILPTLVTFGLIRACRYCCRPQKRCTKDKNKGKGSKDTAAKEGTEIIEIDNV